MGAPRAYLNLPGSSRVGLLYSLRGPAKAPTPASAKREFSKNRTKTRALSKKKMENIYEIEIFRIFFYETLWFHKKSEVASQITVNYHWFHFKK